MLISTRMAESHTPAPFDAKAEAWDDYTATPLGRLRQELTLRHVIQSLPSTRSGLSVLDAGGGTGSYAIPLARQGHHIHLLDFSPRMLAIAQQKIEQAAPSLLKHIDFWCAPVEEITQRSLSDQFDVVLCHTLLEYVASPRSVLRSLISVLRPGGLVSLLFTNPYADAIRWAVVKMDLEKAHLALHQTASSADLFGLPRRGLPADIVREAMDQAEVQIVAEYGVRIFADYMPPERLTDGEFFARVLELEEAASALHPYRLFARYHQMLGRKAAHDRPIRGPSVPGDS
jgi:S-adenosylmethionine-dependent methyltransferase